jgi:putative FmdB family regulatory protein
MPTYEYACTVCGHKFQHIQNMSDQPVKDCPQCTDPVRRLISGGAGFIMKRSGINNVPTGETKDSCCVESAGCEKPKRCCQKE